MVKIGLFDEEFRHLPNYCGYDVQTDMEWVRDSYEPDILVFTERCYDKVQDPRADGKIKVAWPLEPRAIHSYAYSLIEIGAKLFDYVLTFDSELTDFLRYSNTKVKFWTPGGSWIWLRDWSIYPKSKMVSIVAGMKDWTDGHKLRHEVIEKLGSKFDLVCGYGRKAIEPKSEIFKDFRYSVVIENSKVNNYWTDKLIDCFACGTVPIFWGCPGISNFFDPAGIIEFETPAELGGILDNLSVEDYERRKGAIQDNFIRAQKYVPVEKFMFNNIFSPILEGKQ